MDNFPAITLATFPVEMEFSSGHYIIGPRAVICAPNPAAVEGALQQDPTPALPGNGWQKLRGNLLPVPAYPGFLVKLTAKAEEDNPYNYRPATEINGL
jgi:hypothetical protein